ncbi:hypothetical protein [Vibrio cyclitrophicus]|nr:hypothetical protein [Vibrio cyclitrophicus]
MQLSASECEVFSKLLKELARTHKVWLDDPEAYYQKVKMGKCSIDMD